MPHDEFLRRIYIGCAIAAVATKIWLTLAFQMRAANTPADDLLYMRLAEQILHGEWLGHYDQYTLAKGPFFSIWIAGAFLLNIPLLLSYQLLHALACVLMIIALMPLLRPRFLCLALFLLLLFDPSTYSPIASWVIRESIYASLTMMVLAGMIALIVRLERRPGALVFWAIELGIAAGAFATLREEGVWILPAVILALLYATIMICRTDRQRTAKLALVFMPAAIAVAWVLGICTLNQRYYGIFEVTDFKSEGFLRANGALMRVKHAEINQFANVPKEVREKVYKESPTFAELEVYLEGPLGQAWGKISEKWLSGGTPNAADIRGGFFVWAMRDAVGRLGHYQTAAETDAYYTKVANEINSACDAGRLDCWAERSSLLPPWRRSLFTPAIASIRKGVRMVATLDELDPGNMPTQGSADIAVMFEDLGRSRLSPRVFHSEETPRLANQAQLDKFRFGVLNRLNHAFRVLWPFATAVGCLSFLIACVIEVRVRTFDPVLPILMVLIASFAARLGILALVSITSFEAMQYRLLLPVYPMVILFWFLSTYRAGKLGISHLSAARRSRREDEKSELSSRAG